MTAYMDLARGRGAERSREERRGEEKEEKVERRGEERRRGERGEERREDLSWPKLKLNEAF